MDKQGKETSFKVLIVLMLIAMGIATLWDKSPILKNSVGYVLNPTLGWLLNLNMTWGMIIIIFVLTLITTLVQKYATDQEELRKLKKEQKDIGKEMKENMHDVEKRKTLQSKQFESMPKMMKLSMRPMMFTIIPLILFFRWFMDYFGTVGDPRFFGILSWFWFYLIGSIIISSILRKVLKVV